VTALQNPPSIVSKSRNSTVTILAALGAFILVAVIVATLALTGASTSKPATHSHRGAPRVTYSSPPASAANGTSAERSTGPVANPPAVEPGHRD
jgi:hypothetical protein